MPLSRSGHASVFQVHGGITRLAIRVILLVTAACSGERTTEPVDITRHLGTASVACPDGCFIDNFTDVDGKLLEIPHTGWGSSPFTWTQVNGFGSSASIKDNSVSVPLAGQGWLYLTSAPAGDWVELSVDVGDLASDSLFHEVVIYLRGSPNADAYHISWDMCGNTTTAVCSGGLPQQGHGIAFTGGGDAGTWHQLSLDPPSPGLHTFRAEILNNSSTVQVTMDGSVVATHTYPTLLPTNRAGIQFLAASLYESFTPAQVRITSFAAALAPCPPSGDPVLDAPDVRRVLYQSLANSLPNSAPELRQRRERGGVIYQSADGAYHAAEGIDPQATVCDFSHARAPVSLQPGDVPKAGFHTHPHKTNDKVYDDCKRVPAGGWVRRNHRQMVAEAVRIGTMLQPVRFLNTS